MEQLGIDDVYERIGEFGWKQKIYFLLIGVLGLYGPFHQLQMVFVGHDPGFMCQAYFGNGTSLLNSCPDNRVDKCEKITYLGSLTSVVTTWNLVCDRAYLAKTAQSVYMLGTMAIGLPGGRLSDKFGRKRVVVICILMTIICGGMQAFVHDYRSYLLSKFFQGCFYAGTIPSFVLLLELLGPSRRGAVGTLSGLWFSIGIILLSGVAYFVQDWKEFVLVINVGGLVVPALLLLVPESPRWLLLHGREAEAKAVWSSIAEGNGKKFDPSWKIIGNAGVTDSDESASSLLRNPALRRITLIQIFSWFTNSVVYYGLALAAGNFGKDLYLASALSGAVEIPGTLLLLVVFLCMGRCAALGIFMIGGGLSCVIIEFLPQNEFGASSKFILGLLGKLCISASFSVIYIHSTEIYPTRIRTAALGFFFMSSRVGSVVAPFVGLADTVRRDLQFTIYGVFGIAAGVLNLWLPETAGRPMPQTMSDLILGLNNGLHKVRKSRVVQLTKNGLRGLREDVEEEMAMVPMSDPEAESETSSISIRAV